MPIEWLPYVITYNSIEFTVPILYLKYFQLLFILQFRKDWCRDRILYNSTLFIQKWTIMCIRTGNSYNASVVDSWFSLIDVITMINHKQWLHLWCVCIQQNHSLSIFYIHSAHNMLAEYWNVLMWPYIFEPQNNWPVI